MAQKSELETIIKANNTQFLAKMKESVASVNSFTGQVKSKMAGLNKLLTTGLIIGAAGTGVSIFKSTLDDIDNLSTAASKLNINTDQFQFLEFAAKRTDTSLETLTGSIQKLKTRLAKSVGGDDVSQAVNALGLSLEELKSMSPDEAFLSITSALKEIPNEYDRIAIGTKLFSKNFQELGNFIQGSIGQIKGSFNELGGAVDLKGFDEADKAMDELEQSSKQLGRELALTFAGPAASALTKFTQGIQVAKSVINGTLEDKLLQLVASDVLSGVGDTQLIRGNPSPNRADRLKGQEFAGASLADTNAVQGTAKSLLILQSATDAAAGSLAKIKEINIKDLLGISPTSGKDYLASILTPDKQTQNDQFTALANQLKDNITSGSVGFGLSNESIVKTLEDIARNTQPGSGESKSGMIAAVSELKKQLSKREDLLGGSNPKNMAVNAATAASTAVQQTVNVKISVDNGSFIKAVVESPTFNNETIKNINKLAQDSARAAGG